MTLEILDAKFATLSAAYAARDTDQAAVDAANDFVNAAVEEVMASFVVINNQARIDANSLAVESAARISAAAAVDALADYAAAFEEFKNQ